MIQTTFLSGGTNNFQTTADHENAIATDFISPGVVGTVVNTSGVSPQTGPYAVNAQSTPDTTVAILTGVLYAQVTPNSQNSQVVRVKMDSSQNVTIGPNSTGATVYDYLYMKIDPTLANNPDANASTVSTLFISRSTSATTDTGTPPAYGLLLAVISVANNFVTITNGNITDKRISAVVGSAPLFFSTAVGGTQQGTGSYQSLNAGSSLTLSGLAAGSWYVRVDLYGPLYNNTNGAETRMNVFRNGIVVPTIDDIVFNPGSITDKPFPGSMSYITTASKGDVFAVYAKSPSGTFGGLATNGRLTIQVLGRAG